MGQSKEYNWDGGEGQLYISMWCIQSAGVLLYVDPLPVVKALMLRADFYGCGSTLRKPCVPEVPEWKSIIRLGRYPFRIHRQSKAVDSAFNLWPSANCSGSP